jgi:CRP-like cAMP-binding protein
VFAATKLIELQTHDILNEMGEVITHCYFMNSGHASVLNVMTDGKSVEIGLSGKEDFVGLPLVVGLSTSPTRVVTHNAGAAFRITAAKMRESLETCPQLERPLNRYSQALALQATHVAACNRLHEVEERLARWWLMCQDQIGGDCIPLTQEFLAHILGDATRECYGRCWPFAKSRIN